MTRDIAGEDDDRCEFTGFSGHQCLYRSGHDAHLVDQQGGRAVISPMWPEWETDLRERIATAQEALPPENATGSRDFGRGYAQAVKDCARLARGETP